MSDRNYDKLFTAGNAAQLEKLKEKEYKSGFGNLSIHYVLTRIQDELDELSNELYKMAFDYNNKEIGSCFKSNNEIDWVATRRELADIANFAHMGVLTCDKEIEKKKEGT